MIYVYIIQNELSRLYTGSTIDLRRRLKEHNSGVVYSTKNHTWKLIYYEAYLNEHDARMREKRLKQYGWAMTHLKRRINNSLNSN